MECCQEVSEVIYITGAFLHYYTKTLNYHFWNLLLLTLSVPLSPYGNQLECVLTWLALRGLSWVLIQRNECITEGITEGTYFFDRWGGRWVGCKGWAALLSAILPIPISENHWCSGGLQVILWCNHQKCFENKSLKSYTKCWCILSKI
jgi:hypothetical protein